MTIVQHSHEDTSVLYVKGPLRTPIGPALRQRLEALISRGQRRFLVDLAGISDLDAAGVGELVRVYNMAAAANSVLRVMHAVGDTRDLLARVGLLGLLSVEEELGALSESNRAHRCSR